jgi:hypothetical protein
LADWPRELRLPRPGKTPRLPLFVHKVAISGLPATARQTHGAARARDGWRVKNTRRPSCAHIRGPGAKPPGYRGQGRARWARLLSGLPPKSRVSASSKRPMRSEVSQRRCHMLHCVQKLHCRARGSESSLSTMKPRGYRSSFSQFRLHLRTRRRQNHTPRAAVFPARACIVVPPPASRVRAKRPRATV